MGDHVRAWSRAWWKRVHVGGVLALVVMSAGCSGAPDAESAAAAADVVAPPPPATATTQTSAPAEPAAAELTAIAVNPSGDGAADVVLRVDGPLSWTSFDSDAGVVVELRGVVPRGDVATPEPASGPVRTVTVDVERGSDPPLSRVSIATRGEVESTLEDVGGALTVRLRRVEATTASAPAVEAEPVDEAEEVAAATPVPAATPLGTPEEPVRGPEPRGILGSWLRSVAVEPGAAGTEVMLRGDGQFRYSSFGLEDPSRVVVDLEGVAAAEPWSSIPAGDGPVERVRAAQHRVDPEPMTRIVVDLGVSVAPVIEPLPTGLRLFFPRQKTRQEVVAEIEAEAARMGPEGSEAAARPMLAADGEGVPTQVARMASRREPGSTPTPRPAAGEPSNGPAEGADPKPAPQPTADPEPESEPEPNPGAETTPEVAPTPAPRPAPDPEPVSAPDPEPSVQAPPPQETQDTPAEPTPEPAPESTSQAPLVVEPPADDEVRLRNDEPAAGQNESTSGFESQTISQATREYHGEPIDVTITDADLKATLRDFAQLSGLNIVVHPDVSGSVTVNLKGVPWDQALEQILKMNDLAYEIEGNIMRVAPRAQFQEEAQAEQERIELEALSTPLQTVIKRVSYGTASEVAAVLRGETGASVLSERGSVVVDDRTNTLIIRELPRYMDTVLSIVEHLDAAEPQVHIEARIVETNKEFSRTLGIQWGFAGVADAAHGNTTGLEFPNNISGEGAVNLIRGNDNGFLDLSMGNVLNTFTLDATLQAAENDGLANILSTPSVTVLNNEQAEIQSGVSVPIQTVANNTVAVQYVNATLRLLVTPHVTADGTVLLDIDIHKRQPRPDLLVADATNLPIATREARTRVIVSDGGTTVIGGIYEVETNEAEDRVPGLANIPLLGHLFRNKSRQESNDELLIFITPRVLKL